MFLWFLGRLLHDMCILYLLFTFTILCGRCHSSATYDGWGYLNLQCRDNDNQPVDWWYIYKPPGDLFPPQSAHNFSYTTSNAPGRWHVSKVPIDKDSMLVHTLFPMYKLSFKRHVAVAIYQNRPYTSARGVLMADPMGGLLLSHTVPGFPNIQLDRPDFPPEQAPIGHLLVCVSLDSEAINDVAYALTKINPQFVYVNTPESLEDILPAWNFENIDPREKRVISSIEFTTRGNTNVSLLARPPGVKTCLYTTFAQNHGVILNVYGQSQVEYLSTVCSPDYGVRNIDIISLKYPEEVHYIMNSTDRTWFAISTAAYWQDKGAGPIQYWTCTSSVDKEVTTGVGALLFCIQDYDIWRSFDNLKVKEPVC